MRKPRHDQNEGSSDSSFEDELGGFLGTSPLETPPGYAAAICRRVKAEKQRQDRVYRAGSCVAAAIAVCAAVWFGVVDRENTAETGTAGADPYVEVHLMEELLDGAEALADEEALETLDFLLGG